MSKNKGDLTQAAIDAQLTGISKKQSKYKSLDQKLKEKELTKWHETESKIEENFRKKLNKQLSKLTLEEQDKLDKQIEAKRQKTLNKNLSDWSDYYKKQAKIADTALGKIGNTLAANISSTVSKSYSALTSGIDNYLGAYSKYMSAIETRLYGSDKSFSSLSSRVSDIGASPYVSQRAMLDNLSKLIDKGINYNIEQRAFLATVSDKIATTFDAANGTLLQLIRIQQADTTAARLGLEAGLTRFFNKMFSDTSYLSNTFGTVSSSLLGATSQMGYQQGVEFEYAVQKWLGSLGSVGVNESTLQSLASGLSSLATGDIRGLSGSPLERLFLMSGLDYGSTLTGGLNTQTANQLLQNVIETLQSVGRSQNQVVKAQYANLFGVTMSDLSAIMNLTSQDLVSISKNMLTYKDTIQETTNGLNQISSRMTLQDKISNVFDNIMAGVGENIANSAVTYTTWLVNDLVEKATGGITNIEVAPFGVGVSSTVTQLVKAGIVGLNVIAEIPAILSGLFGNKGLSLDVWGATETTSRGAGFSKITAQGVTTTTSQTAYIGQGSESAIFSGSIANIGQQATQVSGQEEIIDINTIIRDDISVDLKVVKDKLIDIYSILSLNGVKVSKI